MRRLAVLLLLVIAVSMAVATAVAKPEERVQIWQYQDEEPLSAPSLDPSIQSVSWREGDLEITFVQAAPCGAWLPVDPVWKIEKFNVTLNFTWYPRFPSSAEPTAVCKKFVRAWVFRVPRGEYKVNFSSAVPRYSQSQGKVSFRAGHQ